MGAIDLKRSSEAAGSAREIEKPDGLAVTLHEFNALNRLEGSDENCSGDSRGLAHDIQHEVRAIVEKNIGMAGREIHRTNARSWALEVVTRRVAGRIGFGFHDAAAEAAGGEIVDDGFSNEETGELDGVIWKLGTAEAADREFLR